VWNYPPYLFALRESAKTGVETVETVVGAKKTVVGRRKQKGNPF
jgi:hypothetical protein